MSDEKVNKNEQLVEEGEELPQTVNSDDVIEGEFVDVSPDESGEPQAAEEASLEEEEPSLEDQLQEAQDEAAKNRDSYLRAQAELANARKRFEKQRALTYVNANADLVSKLLPVLDDYERAIDTVPEAVSQDPWYQGVELVYRKLLSILESLNVKEIEALGIPFDPNFHEALGTEPTDDVESGSVSRVMLKGYQIGDKVVRPSLVYVAD
ncbi:MAG: nucleotide exchange factor GrpE [Candidatus Promineifilaceae bacterium]